MGRALVKELLPLWKLCEGNMKGGLFYWRPWRIYKKRLRKQASFSIKASLENLKVGSFTGDFERRAKAGPVKAACLCESSVSGN
jgi:hypothetical protein